MNARSPAFALPLFALLFTACGGSDAPPAPVAGPAAPPPVAEPVPPPPPADPIATAVKDPTRDAEARARDPFRKPAEILTFAGVKPGDSVVEIVPGAGYDTALLSRVVGPSGRVYAVDSERLFEYMPSLRESFPTFMEADPRENVEYSVQRLDALEMPAQVDFFWMSMFYHDTVWLGVDRAAMNRYIYEHLKPGGVYLVVDHHAASGAGDTVTRDIHRIDADQVRREVEAAGFRLAAMSDALMNMDDPRDVSVFDDAWRGRTDRFVYKFVKPR
jgi:predicted methyltransferase